MIVKNESQIIERLLTSVLPLIDTYCICDTGSTDNTIEIIENFFQTNDIQGKIVNEPFRDFGYNRTFAMKQCISMPNSDYLLLLDADMVLEINPSLDIQQFKCSLQNDAYYLLQGTENFYYKNVRILKNNPEYSYWGVTHEYVKTTPTSSYANIEKTNIFIRDIGDGGSKTEKTERDIRLLTKGLEELPNNDRYTFYLANSYHDSGNFVKAIETYKKRIEIGGWAEEVWFSHYTIGKCYINMGQPIEAIHYWLEAYEVLHERVENIYEIVTYYRQKGTNKLAYRYYEMAKTEIDKKKSYDHLFLRKDVYDHLLDYELSIIGYYFNPSQYDLPKICMKVLINENADENIKQNIFNNLKFYAPKLKTFECPVKSRDFKNNYELLKSIGNTIVIDRDVFVSSTPSVVYDLTHANRYTPLGYSRRYIAVNVRFVNYRIGEQGQYINQEKIITRNVIAIIDTINPNIWQKVTEFELFYDDKYDNIYVGLEDIRLWSFYEHLGYNANRGLNNKMMVESGFIRPSKKRTIDSTLLKSTDNQKHIEKNWVSFPFDESRKIIYEWSPIIIGKVIDKNHEDDFAYFEVEKKIETPSFFKNLRGSTNGILVDGELWFICHLVNYEDRRYYYHIFVVLDRNTLALKRYSKLFTFEGEKVEYTLGFIYIEEMKQFLIGYSCMDCKTEYMLIPKPNVMDLFT
jgi:tetratricopeptide (TPR) repeat protein